MQRTLFAIALALAAIPVAFADKANAETINWHSVPKDADKLEFFGMVKGDVEGDTVVRVICEKGGKMQVTVGAYKDLGKGKPGALSVTLASGNVSVTLKGKSVQSDNFEMTGFYEMRTEPFPINDAAIRLLPLFQTKKPITVTGSMKATWTTRGVEKLAQDFEKGCLKG
jgi:hypothetical protein